jgi:hypothetical protein
MYILMLTILICYVNKFRFLREKDKKKNFTFIKKNIFAAQIKFQILINYIYEKRLFY